MMKVKNSAIIYTAYDYQTLHGVRLLAEWLHNPTRFVRAAFEADKDSNDAPNGIDDIIFERTDGVLDFWQVKFTPSPEKDENGLIWDWLLTIPGKTDRSRSILKKLFDAISAVPVERLGEVILLTNKRPDRIMESCLRGSQINFEQIDVANKEEIIRQLGSQDAATFLFSNLTIQHGDGDYHNINRSVRFELLKFSDDAGAERLISRAREWAMFKNIPSEGGWIYLHNIREVLSPKRPDPIPEIFSVPADYCLPDIDFHSNLLAQVTASKGEVITLTGKPGVGKSTYLSFLCQALEEQDIPLVRHHYFLSLGDTTNDRLSPRIVAESLLYQISSFHKKSHADTSQPEILRDALIACANYYKSEGKPFVVLVDGLDHVWRDNAKNKKPLDEIFRQLLPTTDNLVVIVGTQPVDDELLPHTLLTHSAKAEWLWLLEMSGNSIYEFLKLQVNAGRLFLNCHEDHTDEEIRKSANALLDITNGYPLHVIYSSEFLSHHGLPLSTWEIEKLPPCSDGNIISYYSELWRHLNYRQKDVLHLCSGFQFAWPRQAIGTVVKDEHNYSPSVDAVAHMLSEGGSGVRPFHESLVVFVRNQKEHQERINALLPDVCQWLSSEAPPHLKDNWLWSSLARAGDSTQLRQGVTRDWFLDRLNIGMPVKSCIRLLSEAETYAFEEFEYAEACRHRELKTRLLNGPEFQIWDQTSLKMLSLLQADDATLNEIIAGQNEYSPIKLSVIATALWYRGQSKEAQIIARKAIERYRAKTKLLSSSDSQDNEAESVTLIKAGVLTDALNYDAIFDGDNFSTWSDGYMSSFHEACCIKHDIDLLLRAWGKLPEGASQVGEFEINVIRLSIIEDIDITCRPEYSSFSSQQLSCFLDTFSHKHFVNVSTHYFDDQSTPGYKVKASGNYHNWFFSSLCIRLNADGDFTWLPVGATLDRADVDTSAQYNLLNQLADCVANELLAGNTLDFDMVCSMFPSDPILDEIQMETRRANIMLKRDWIEIAADCHLITTKSEISRDVFKRTIDAGLFHVIWLRLWYKELGFKLLSDDAVELLITLEVDRQINELEETIENSNTYLELAQIAFQHEHSVLFEKCLRKVWDFVLGYGHHKDPMISHVMDAVEYLSAVDPNSALEILERISPIVFNISEFTDGDETSHSKHSLSALVAGLNPQTVASIYEQELRDGEWYDAEETVQELLERCDLASPITRCLYLTALHSNCRKVLQKEIEEDKPQSLEIAAEMENLLGVKNQSLDEENPSQADEIDEKITLKSSDYPPDKFEELAGALKGELGAGKFWETWYAYWTDQGQESELLKYLIPHVETFMDHYGYERYLLDLLFNSQRKLSGKTKAFDLLVAAHNAMNGWSEWYERAENSRKRLRIVAEQYPKRVDEFVTRTTSQTGSWSNKFGNLIIPNEKLVFLLTQSGREKEALQFTLAMVEGLEESVRNLNLKKPEWDWCRDDFIEEACAKVLVSRLKQPVPTIKLLVIEQISQLLIDCHPKIEKLLIEDLASRKQESECVEVLCVFLVAKCKGHVPPNDLGRHINARSTLSDLILTKLASNPKDFGTYAYPFEPVIHLDGDNHRFNYFQGNHIPLLYNSWLKEEEQKTGIPFTDYYQSEWNNTFEYQSAAATQIDYFLGRDRQKSTGQFYTQASHRGRSAYLRTIEIAKKFYGMPDAYAAHLSIPALPIEPAYIGLNPQRPSWLPNWNGEMNPDRDNLIRFVKNILADFYKANDSLELLALSMPSKLDNNRWIDLTIIQAEADEAEAADVKIEERSGCFCVGSLLEGKLTYKFGKKSKSKANILAITPYPFMRYGHWHSDLESRGLYVPNCNIDGEDVTGASKDGIFSYSVDDTKVGFSSFWYNNWKPSHPKGIRSLCGTFTAVEKNKLHNWWQPDKKREQLFVCKATTLLSEESYREFESEIHEFRVPF